MTSPSSPPPSRSFVSGLASGFAAWRAAACALAAAFTVLMLAAPPAAAEVLVSNIGKDTNAGENISLRFRDLALGFTTGPSDGGYSLESVGIEFFSTPSAVTITIATGVSTTSGGTTVATLTNPATLVGNGVNTFTAPAGTILSASTTYYVVMDGDMGSMPLTASTNEDAGAAAGWSIANRGFVRVTASDPWEGGHHPAKIRVNGEQVAPAFSSAAVDGKALTVTFTKDLDPTSRPPGNNMWVTATANGESRGMNGGAGNLIRISGKTATMRLGSAVVPGESVVVTYRKRDDSPLQDSAGNDVANFTDQPVANNTRAPMAPDPMAPDEGAAGRVHLVDTGSQQNVGGPSVPTGHAESGPGWGQITVQWTPGPVTSEAAAATHWCLNWREASSLNPTRFPFENRTCQSAETTHSYTFSRNPDTRYDIGVRGWDQSGGLYLGGYLAIAQNVLAKGADAGDDLTVPAGARVVLDGTGADRPGTRLTYAWTQTGGPTVRLDDATSATPPFVAPSVSSSTALTFSLTVSDGTNRDTDTVTVTVLPSRVKSATVDGDELSVTFDAELDARSKPAGSAFTVTATKPGSSRTIRGTAASVAISGATVTATLSAAVAADERLTVRYDRPASGAVLEDSGGNALPSVPDRPAGNVAGDTTGPAFVSAQVNGTTATITFDEPLDESAVPGRLDFWFQFGGASATLRPHGNPSLSGNVVTIQLTNSGGAVSHDETVRFAYDPPTNATNRIRDLAGNAAAAIAQWEATVNVTPPKFKSASVDEDELTITFDGGLDQTSVPAASAFTVKATRGGTERDVALAATGAVSVDGATVVLTLAEAVLPAAVDTTVTVAYAAPATGELRDADNLKLAVTGFGDTKTATNATPADTTAPTVESVAVNGGTMTVKFSEALDESSVPRVGAFSVVVKNVSGPAGGVSISGDTVTLSLAVAAEHDQLLRMNYTQTTGARLKDLSGNEVVTTPFFTATNNTPPKFKSATVDEDELTITFDGGLKETSVPAASAFTVKATRGGTERDVALAATGAVDVDGATVVLTLAETLLRVETVTVAYAAPATGAKLEDAEGLTAPVPDFAAQAVTNATPADTTAPTLVSTQLDETTLTMTYDEDLDESAVPGKAAFEFLRHGGTAQRPSGSPSVSGKVVTVPLVSIGFFRRDERVRFSYTLRPDATKRIRDLAGNEAAAIARWGVVDTIAVPPRVNRGSVNGDELTLTFNGDLDETSVPAASAFTVEATRAGKRRDVALAATGAVSVSGSTVVLALAETLLRVERPVHVNYDPPETGALQAADDPKLPVPAFNNTATNDTPEDTNAPAFVSAQANGRTVTVTFDELLDESVTQSGTLAPFGLRPSGALALRFTVSGDTVTLTMAAAAAVSHGQQVTLEYQTPAVAADRFKDLSGNELAAFSGKAVTNVTPPAYSSASVDGSSLTITFDGDLDETSVPAASAFTVKATRAGTERDVALAASGAVEVDGATVVLTLAETLLRVETVTVAYTAPATGAKLQDADQQNLPVTGFGDAKTATNATPADTTGPAFVSAQANGRTVTVTFDELLDESVTQSGTLAPFGLRPSGALALRFTVSGDTVTLTMAAAAAVSHGQQVTLEYQTPAVAADRFKDLSGNELAAFSGKAVTNVTPPAYSSASVDGSSLTITFDGDLDETSVPAASAFTVKATRAGTERDVALAASGAVEVDGATVVLTLAETLLRVETVTVAYTAPATGAKLQDADQQNLPVTGFGDAKTATNATPADTNAPAFVSAQANGRTVTVTFDELLDESVTQSGTLAPFGLRPSGALALRFTVSGDTVTLTMAAAAAVSHGQQVTLEYQTPAVAADRFKDLSGNELAAFSGKAVTNVTPPAYSSASVDGSSLTITFDGDLDETSVPAASAFTVKATRAGTERDVALAASGAVEVDGATVVLTLAETLLRVETVTVAYTAPATGAKLQDADQQNLPVTGFGDAKTATNATPADTNAPAFVSASVNGAALTVTFDEALDEGSVPAAAAFTVTAGGTEVDLAATTPVAVDGSAVTLALAAEVAAGQAVTVGYDKAEAGAGTLRDAFGNEAPSFAGKPVDNATPVPEARIASVAVVSAPTVDADNDGTAETYGRGEVIRVTVSWSADVLWDVSAADAAMAVRLDVGGTARTASLLTGGATAGQARALSFEYAVVQADADADGIDVTRTAAHDVVVLSGGAMLEDTHGRDASRSHAALAAGAGHKVDGARAAETAAPVATAGTVDGATGREVTLTFDKDLAAMPAAKLQELRKWGLTVVGAYVEGVRIPGLAPERIAIDGPTLTLHLRSQFAAHEILPGRPVSVGYRADLAANGGFPLRGANGEAVAAFTRTMTRAGAPEPLLTEAAVAGTKLTLTFDEALDEDSAPLGRRFQVTADHPYRSNRLIYGTGVARVSGKTVAVTLGSAVAQYENAWLSYQKGDDPNPLRRASPSPGVQGPVARDFNGFLHATVHDRTAPKPVSAVVAGTQLVVYYNETLDTGSMPATTAWTVDNAGTGVQPAHVRVTASAVTLTLPAAQAPAAEAAVTVSYTPPETNPLRDAAGNRAEMLDGHEVDSLGPSDPGAPTLNSAVAQDGVLTLTWDQPLDPVHTPVPAKFSLSQPVARSVTGVAVRGDAVELALSRWVTSCSAPFTVSYAAPGEHENNTLRNLLGARAGELSAEPVTIVDTVRPWCPIVRGTVEAQSGAAALSMRLDRALRRSPAPSVDGFSVDSDGGGDAPAGPVGVEQVEFPADPAGLRLTLSRALTAGERLTVSYRQPGSGPGLQDTDGNGAAPFSTETVVSAGTPAATAVAVASDAGDDATYAAGDAVRVAVTFDEAVEVDTAQGTPRLKLDLGGDDGAGARWAVYEDGSGTDTLTFAWTAATPDEAAAGVAVLADTLELDGGTIRSAATQTDAALGHPGLDPDPAHKVDAVAPELVRGEIDSATMTLWFSEALDPDFAGGRFLMGIRTSETASLGCHATGGVSIDGATATIGLGGNCPPAQAGLTEGNDVTYFRHAEGHDGSLRDLAGNLLATEGDAGNGLYVDIELENVTGKTAAVTGAEVVTDAGADGAYTEGETVEAAVTFDAPVTVGTADGTPTLALIANGGIRRAAYVSGSGTGRLAFAYRVVEADGPVRAPVRVAASGLRLNGGSIASAAGKPASLGFGEAPGVTAVSVGTQDGGRWEAGDTVEAVLTFAEPVTIEGAPSVGLVLEGAIRRAVYAAGSGTDALAFRYTLGEGDGPWARAALAGNSLRLDGGSIASAGGGLAAALGHGGTGASGETADPPAVTGVTVVSDAGSDATYGLGERIRVRVAFGEAVAVTGSPGIAIDMDPAEWGEKRAVYESGSGTDALIFVHEVVEPNLSTRGIAVLADTLILHGGATIRSAATQTDAAIGHGGLDHDPAHKVDWRLAPATEAPSSSGPPSVTGVEVVSDAGSDSTYLLGDTIRVRLAFSEAVKVTGTPKLSIDMDPADWGTKRAAYEGATGTAALALSFAWTVVEPNLSPRGIAVLADSLALDGGTIRSAATGAAAALGHSGIGHDAAHKVDWRPTLSVADARAREGVDEAVVFEVSLDRVFTGTGHRVTVDYATADGTAKAGEDYTATTGTLTFAAGERVKTVSVPILDDGHDEGHETFLLRLSNVAGAREGDLEATGTIENTDKMPKAWNARFGRTVAMHVVDALDERLEQAPSDSYIQLGGRRLGGGPDVHDTAQRLAPERDLWAEAESAATPGQDMSPRQLLLDSAFHLLSSPEHEGGGPRLSAWGRVATSGFDGREDNLSLSGTVTTATLGMDGIWKRWLTGLLLAYSEGDGSFSQGDLPDGDVSSSLTSVHPYVSYTLSDRVRLWGLVGYGSGALQLRVEDHRAMHTDLTMTMGALGMRGDLLEPAQRSGFQLALRSDVLWMVMDSAAADNLAATEAEASRLRLVLEGSRPVALSAGGSFTPSLELGLRHDWGDAETGTGVEVGGSLRYASAWGLSIEASVRALLAHEAEDYTEWGAGGALRFDPGRQGRGLTASITPTWGAAGSATSRLWDQRTITGLVPADALAPTAAGRLEAELGYGLATLKGRGLLTPYARVALTEGADQAWHLGTRLALAETLNLSLEASRRARDGDVAAHELALRANLGF